MTGGTEGDIFFFRAGESEAGAGLRDVITDFAVGEDKINLASLNLDASQISFNSFNSGRSTVLAIDTDGDTVVDYEIQLNNATGVTLADLLI
jgi:Ca2+-binding RTX toxin-like protein